jgi:hypothetical protein
LATEANVLEMIYSFVIELDRVKDDGPLDEHIVRVADVLHSDQTLSDVAIGVDLAVGRVEFELGAVGVSPNDASKTVWDALMRALKA